MIALIGALNIPAKPLTILLKIFLTPFHALAQFPVKTPPTKSMIPLNTPFIVFQIAVTVEQNALRGTPNKPNAFVQSFVKPTFKKLANPSKIFLMPSQQRFSSPVNTPTKKSVKPWNISITLGINSLIKSPHDLNVSLNDPTIKSTNGDNTLSHTQLIASPIAWIPGFHVFHTSNIPDNAIDNTLTRKFANGASTFFQSDKAIVNTASTALTNVLARNIAIGTIIVLNRSNRKLNIGTKILL